MKNVSLIKLDNICVDTVKAIVSKNGEEIFLQRWSINYYWFLSTTKVLFVAKQIA